MSKRFEIAHAFVRALRYKTATLAPDHIPNVVELLVDLLEDREQLMERLSAKDKMLRDVTRNLNCGRWPAKPRGSGPEPWNSEGASWAGPSTRRSTPSRKGTSMASEIEAEVERIRSELDRCNDLDSPSLWSTPRETATLLEAYDRQASRIAKASKDEQEALRMLDEARETNKKLARALERLLNSFIGTVTSQTKARAKAHELLVSIKKDGD